jgi:hypothetical protein
MGSRSAKNESKKFSCLGTFKVMRSCLVAGDICSDACAESLLRCCGHHDKLSREEQVEYRTIAENHIVGLIY